MISGVAMTRRLVLTVACPDRIGIVAAVSRVFAERGCNTLRSAQFEDEESRRFFLRTVVALPEGLTQAGVEAALAPVAADFGMTARMYDADRKARVLVMVSRFGHCLNDLVFRAQSGALPIEIAGVVSNHTDFERLARHADLDFHHLPMTPDTKAAQEAELARIVEASGAELIVLARYMQVLSPEFCGRFPERILNIHHSFLPSFKGAKPYHRAHARGVKLIGATAHYVTADLDEGPIIEQGVERVTHAASPDDLVAIGRDIEAVVLARAVKWWAERRVLLNGARTVVFA